MGFGAKWISWMKWCISTASFSILLNGSPTGFFRSSRGLRQGDPLSPYLFVIVMEALSCLLSRAKEGGFLSGWAVGGRGREGIEITHLLFADDTLVFCKPSSEQMVYLGWLLLWFEALSGLRVNLEKSEIIPVGTVENLLDLASELNCRVGALPSTYLGLPLGARYKDVAVWDVVEERLRRKLAAWKRQYISKGGHLTLIRSTLASIPIYFMSLFTMPSRVRGRLEQIQRDFLWGGGSLERRPHLARWSLICSNKGSGGLGVRSLATLNKALLCKWNWRFAVEREALWRKIIGRKYGVVQGGWRTKDVKVTYGVGLWKAITRLWDVMGGKLAFRVGNGKRVRFWKDRWCGEDMLCAVFPTLYDLTVNKEVWVADVWSQVGGGGWDPRFYRSFNDWELEVVEQFFSRIQNVRVDMEVEDQVIWMLSKRGLFSVKSLYAAMDVGRQRVFPARVIWNSWVPPRVVFFAWEATWGKVLTMDNLQRRGWSLANRCLLCRHEEETIDHMLIHCDQVGPLWQLCFALFGVVWVLPGSVKEVLLGWHGSFVGKRRKKLWEAVPLCIFWTIWKERNNRVFDNVKKSTQALKNSLICNLWEWAKFFADYRPSSLLDFVSWVGYL